MGQIGVLKILIFSTIGNGTRRPGATDQGVLALPDNNGAGDD
jgi:hypothetical protein